MSKRIVVFSDGTGQSVGCHDSNVLRLCKMLDVSEDAGQVAIYDPGVGTDVSLQRVESGLPLSTRRRLADSNPDGRLFRRLRQPLELGFGLGTAANIRQLYLALIQEYKPGDCIFLFGFSRGAFTVRALAGLIYRCGLLEPGDASRVDEAIGWCQQHYTALAPRERAAYRARVDAFRRQHSRPANIRFLGVWDTVKSVGYLRPKNLPHTRHNPIVKYVRHALSIDERRSFYVPTTWGGLHGESRAAVYRSASFDLDETDVIVGPRQDVKEVWFPGNHGDVGGGYPVNESAAADNALRWMLTEARACGLRFDAQRVEEVFAEDRDRPVTHRHDEMCDPRTRQLLWWVADHAPRRELHNEPPPPHKRWTRTPAGPRSLVGSLRDIGETRPVLLVHESARGAYPDASRPWRDVPDDSIRFIATSRSVEPAGTQMNLKRR